MLPPDEIFIRLAPHAEVLEPALALAGAGRLPGGYDTREIARLCGVTAARLPAVAAALREAEAVGAAGRNTHGMWSIKLPLDAAREVALLMRGARLYRAQVHSEANAVEVVISRPAAPSQLIAELERSLEGLWGLEETALMLGQMAAGATRRFAVMTPFVDEDGAERIVRLFQATREGVTRQLVVRDGLPAALASRGTELRALGVNVYDFRIPRPDRPENETFHAKVVLVDDWECYAGSSNMTKWSFEYSLELGFHVRGVAAASVARLVDAVMAVSTRIAP